MDDEAERNEQANERTNESKKKAKKWWELVNNVMMMMINMKRYSDFAVIFLYICKEQNEQHYVRGAVAWVVWKRKMAEILLRARKKS